MKKMNLENKIEISRRKAGLAVVTVLSIMSMFVIAGCGKEKSEEPTTPSTTVAKEETTPEVVEPTESTPVETVEPTETVPETEVVEKEPETFDEMIEYLNNSDFSGLKLIVKYEDGTVKLLNDGDEYVCNNNDSVVRIYYSEKASKIEENTGFFSFIEMNDNCSGILMVHHDCESTITVTTVDGNVYEITNSYTFIDTQE